LGRGETKDALFFICCGEVMEKEGEKEKEEGKGEEGKR
jgi:hypothetical protein